MALPFRACLETPVGKNQAIAAKVPVMGHFPGKITAVFPDTVLVYGLIAPFPDAAAGQLGVLPDFLPVIP